MLALRELQQAFSGAMLEHDEDGIRGEISERQVVVGPETFSEGDYSIFGLRFRVDF